MEYGGSTPFSIPLVQDSLGSPATPLDAMPDWRRH